MNPTDQALIDIAYEVVALIDVSRFALENDTDPTPIDHRGIGPALTMCQEKVGVIIDTLELAQKKERAT